jgi:hypothetical protein
MKTSTTLLRRPKKTGNVHANVTLMHIREKTTAMEK